MSIAEKLLTAEEFAALPDLGPAELVRGRIVEMNPPGQRHGRVCYRIALILGTFIESQRLGVGVNNDGGVVTSRNPDTVRGPDFAYYSFDKIPENENPAGYPEAPPDIAFEVISPSDRWAEITLKVGEFLMIGVRAVCVLDPEAQTAQVFTADAPSQQLNRDEMLTFPEILPGFQAPVKEFFK